MVEVISPLAAGSDYSVDVTVWSTRKYDRGEFNVYVGTELLVGYVTHTLLASEC